MFILNRHRLQLAAGMATRDSIALANGTAGNAVTFAGATVIIALAALGITGIPFLGTMGLVAAGTVAVAVLASVTLTPALLSLMGERVLPARQRRRLTRTHDGAHGWAARVARRPWLAIAAVVVVAGVLASPTPQLRLGLPDGGQEPAGSTAYATFDLIRDNFGAGANGPIIAVATLADPQTDEAALTDLQLDIAEDLKAADDVRFVVPFGVSDDGSTLAFQVMPQEGPSHESTVELVDELVAGGADLGAQHAVTIGYTGQTVANIEISAQLAAALPVYLLVVVGLSLILLLLVFRSVWVPLLASAGFLLTVVAAFGGIVATYQLGIFAELTMIRPIGFGLSLGVLVDAFLVRMTLTPAVLTLLGERAWWLPRWLDRVLPNVDVEGAGLERTLRADAAPVAQVVR
ncbi:MMPL family transporter [Georgenia yuyongxinii]|uniref:MMPL family transporter n=1 Tax=Georgenia yuyongxinii TaxID=2589797 RepID=UPI0022AA2279|nr:MMPL family transporter [Georgenia yuyongxinii]